MDAPDPVEVLGSWLKVSPVCDRADLQSLCTFQASQHEVFPGRWSVSLCERNKIQKRKPCKPIEGLKVEKNVSTVSTRVVYLIWKRY